MDDIKTAKVFETKRNFVISDVVMSDLISVKQAAEISGYTVSGIMRKMDVGDLPTYQLGDPTIKSDYEMQKLTSRKAVAALPKAKGERVHSQKKVYSPSYGTLLPLRTILMSVFAPFNRFSFS